MLHTLRTRFKMDLQLLISALSLLICHSSAQQDGSNCIQANAKSCGECIQVGEKCGWCTDPAFLKPGEPTSARCDELESLRKKGCKAADIENPRGSFKVNKNKAVTNRKDKTEKVRPEDITQVQPQKITFNLRSGEAQSFDLKFKRAEDYPIDLYYLMDLSYSMKDDLENVKNLGTDLMKEMKKITSDFRIGFGSFVEKTVMPYISTTPAKLLNPCTGDQNCTSPFSYKNVLKLTSDGQQFNRLDYPSIAHLVQKLSDNNIQTIFAVTNDFQAVYKELKNLIPKSAVGTLSSNSSNVINLIIEAYNSLSSEVILENSKLPEGVSMTYQSHCKNGVIGEGDNGRKCSNISIGDEVSFHISVKANKCPAHGKAEVVKIKPQGFTEEVELVLKFICDCACQSDGKPNSPMCSEGNGTFECGACRCNEGRIGRVCECSTEDVNSDDLEANCRRDNSTDTCSNTGDCICGTCECRKRENPEEIYSGKFCECDNFNCDRSDNKLCGGHGRCDCRVCICDANYTGSACDCSLDTSTCLASNKQICNGRGVCECGTCKCTDPKFQGPTCEICPTCPSVCTQHKECVQCRAFGTGEKKDVCDQECNDFKLTKVSEQSKLPQPVQSFPLVHCKERDADDCWFYFTYAVNNTEKEVHVAEKLECPAGPDIIPIVAGVVAGIVLIGLALLLIWKLLMIIHDRREFAKFEKEKMNAKWDTGENPIYKSAVTTVVNPKYEGK
ncbi:hypothetical protein GJAV_G00089630 [Gymnothorax javanicus]|nr:hypothetical protein GJAV_G00089630 [Gymnothorax javanicus]